MAMIRRVLEAVVVVAAAALATASWAQAEVKLAAGGSWINEDGSVLAITGVAANGLLTGTITTTTGCGARKPHPVTGWYFPGGAGGALSLTVNWEGCNSVTTWTAQYSNATGSFRALWYLAVASAPVWNGVVAGAHLFVPQPAKKP